MNAVVEPAAVAERSWYAIAQAGESGEAEVRIYEDIGFFGVSAKKFADDIEKLDAKTIHVRLNTYGGEAFDGIAIHNALQAHPAKVVVHVDGIAASAGSVVAMAGDEIRMADNAFLMIHEARGGVMGEADDMRHYAEMLDKLNDSIASTYQARAGKTRRHWRSKMADETWFSASEAKDEGLIDAIDAPTESAKARFDFRVYNRAPEAARKAWANPDSTAPENSPSGEPKPVAHSQEVQPNMAETTTNVTAPAQPPAAGNQGVTAGENIAALNNAAIQGYIERGRQLGRAEGRRAAEEDFRAIVTAAPGRPDIACNAFLAGQNAATVALVYDAANKAAESARAELLRKDEEIARLHAVAATGGHAGVGIVPSASPESAGVPEGLEPRAQAEMEYDTSPLIRGKNPNRDHWVRFREMQLRGAVQICAPRK